MTIQAATAEKNASPPIPTTSRLSLSAQVTAATAGEDRVREILGLAARQQLAANNELFAARLVAEDAVIPGTEHRRRWAEAAGRAHKALAAIQAATVIEEPPVKTDPEGGNGDGPEPPEDKRRRK